MCEIDDPTDGQQLIFRPVMRTLVLVVWLAGQATGAAAQTDSVRARGRRYTGLFFDGRFMDIYARFSPSMRQAIDTAKLDSLRGQMGALRAVISEETSPRPPYTLYDETISVEKIPQPVRVRWAIDSAGTIGGFVMRPAPVTEAASPFLDYRTKTPLQLPFTGEWFVVWGGRTLAQNLHASSPDQRFAYDFVITRGGTTHHGDGKQNGDYFCFGQTVLAPGAGAIVEAVDGVGDNTPGVVNGDAPLGNHVVIDHGNGEFSFLAHLERASVAVKTGDHVARGAVVGRCGNSGVSPEPHVHYHIQSTPSYLVGAGMPAQFEHYVADGAPVVRGEPVRGQTIRGGT
jgi:murein DD-endopeptidase MepM/ murein hydrolase activator NlpD